MLRHISNNMNDDCHICLEAKDKKDLIILNCGHSFHASCLFEWFDRNMLCPLCMKKKSILFSTISKYSYDKNKTTKKQCCVIS